jgi:hypothetical protein
MSAEFAIRGVIVGHVRARGFVGPIPTLYVP